jgi:hypothetical protein
MALTSAKRSARRGLRNLGIEAHRVRPSPTPEAVEPTGYYDVVNTCQIPNLSFLYERYLGQP